MSNQTVLLLAVAVLPAPAWGQDADPDLLLFTHAMAPAATRSGIGKQLDIVSPEDVVVVRPRPMGFYSAEKFAPRSMWDSLLGDEDADGIYVERPLAGQIDALCIPCPASDRSNQLEMCVSVRQPVGFAGCGRDITPGDLVMIQSGGVVDYFMTEVLIQQAFNVAVPLDVDAVATLPDGSILLSFNANVTIGGVVLGNGGIAMILSTDLTYAGCMVANVVAGSGFILASEATVDAWVLNANAADSAGAAVATIGDLDGLDLDPAGGFFNVQQEGAKVAFCPNLIFSGVNLTGGGVLSTSGGGSIALLNGVALASTAGTATDGTQVGLAAGSADFLNALEVEDKAPNRFVMDVPTPFVPAVGDPWVMEFNGADPFGLVTIYECTQLTGACGAATSMGVAASGFPEIYPPTVWIADVTANGRGAGGIGAIYAGGYAAGTAVVFQAWTLKAGVQVYSTPITIQF